MTDFEKEYKDRFQNHQSMKGVDSDAIWAGVSGQLDAGKAVKNAGLFSRNRLILGIAALLSVGVAYYFLSDTEEPSTIQSEMVAVDNTDGINTELNTTEINKSQLSDEQNNNLQTSTTSIRNSQEVIGATNDTNTDGDNGIPAAQLKSNVDYTGIVSQLSHSSGGGHHSEAYGAIQDKKNVTQLAAGDTEQADGGVKGDKHLTSLSLGKSDKSNKPPTALNQGSGITQHTGVGVVGNPVSGQSPDGGAKLQSTDPVKDESGLNETITAGHEPDEKQALEDASIQDLLLPMMMLNEQLAGSDGALRSPKNPAGELLPAHDNHMKRLRLRPTELSALVGVNTMATRFNDKGLQLANTFTQDFKGTTNRDLGRGAGLRATWITKGTFRFGIGLDYSELRTQFDKVTTRPVDVTLSDVLIGYTTDSTGVQQPIYGEQTYDGIETRTILHHNKYTMISIPVEIGVQKRYGRMQVGIDAGAAYSLITRQEGRLQSTQAVITDFGTDKDGDLPLAKSMMSFHAAPFFDYDLTEHLSIRLSPMLRYAPSKGYQLQGVNRESFIYSIRGGLVFRF